MEKMEEIESWVKTTSKLANKIFLKQNKSKFYYYLTTSLEYFSHELILQLLPASFA
jgi:hypothetical protein